MPLDWIELKKELSPIKDYADLRRRWEEAFAYPFVCAAYNFSMPEMAAYTQRLLAEDTRGRYLNYAQRLINTFNQLHRSGVRDILDLTGQTGAGEAFEGFSEHAAVPPQDLIAVLKYLVYWFIPMKKYLSGLVSKESPKTPAIARLRDLGIRANLDILQQGRTPADRRALADRSGLAEATIQELVNVADFSRMPWASKATISNLFGAGYGSLEKLANADAQELYQAFSRYGASIGKNLKHGNEIDNSYRIAKILPPVLE